MFQIRLKELRERDQLSQARLAKIIGVGQSAVGMWENGKNKPEHGTLIKLADFFDISLDYLTGNESLIVDSSKKSKGIKIPVLGKVQAGIPIEAIEDILDYEEISVAMAAQGEYFALQLKGDSMEPRMKEGDVVIVLKQSDVDSGDIAIVIVDGGHATCKKIIKHEKGISLVSLNPTFEPMYYTNEEISSLPIAILGKAVELRAKF